MIETDFDIPFVSDLALREKQIQQNYRPLIAIHKWFARRPGTLFRALLLSEFVDRPLRESFYADNSLRGRRVADPFMGGGTPLMEANRLDCEIVGFDINPMSYWIVRQEIERLDLAAYREQAAKLRAALEDEIGEYYRTTCNECGNPNAHVKYFLWVKTATCSCGTTTKLFPGYVVAEQGRHTRTVILCPQCENLTEVDDRSAPGACGACHAPLAISNPVRSGRATCRACHASIKFPLPADGPPQHALFALEYHCARCRVDHVGRYFKAPDANDRARLSRADSALQALTPRFIPKDDIPAGDETDRLHRWGYRRYREMFNSRQLVGLEVSGRLIAAVTDQRVRHALATNLSDLLRYQNMLCRYDTTALKSLDIFSVHGFPVGLIVCESNLLGIVSSTKDGNVGSGGWSNIIEKFAKAKAYGDSPYEYRHDGPRKAKVVMSREWIGDEPNGRPNAVRRTVSLHCQDAAAIELAPASLDAVLTDPPYFGNVQYAELMDFCYVWLRRLLSGRSSPPAFRRQSTRSTEELTGNANMGRDLAHFTTGLSCVFSRMAEALKPGHPFVFTYHHNDITAYYPIVVALLDAGLTCSASLPCPGEMGASIHISGTKSSIVDTVFVCRSTGSVLRASIATDPTAVANMVRDHLAALVAGGVTPTAGDGRCIAFGHVSRLALWHLRHSWQRGAPVTEKLSTVSAWVDKTFSGASTVLAALGDADGRVDEQQLRMVLERRAPYGKNPRRVTF